MKPISRPLPAIAFIVARGRHDHVIGCENHLPWRLRTDMRFFKTVTEQHAVIMGRKTFESIGKPLPDRMNIVISSRLGEDTENLAWATSVESALIIADFYSVSSLKKNVIVMGGEQIYKLFENKISRVFLTEVDHTFPSGDAYFDMNFDMREWSQLKFQDYPISDLDEYPFTISILERKLKYTRMYVVEDFLRRNQDEIDYRNALRFRVAAKRFDGAPDEQANLSLPEVPCAESKLRSDPRSNRNGWE